MAVASTGTALANNGISAATPNVPYTIPGTASISELAIAGFGSSSNVTVSTVPSGWTLIFGPVNSAATFCGFLYYKVLLSGDPGATATWVLSGSQRPTGTMETFSGVDVGTFLANIADVTNGVNVASTSIIAPAVTTRADQSWVVNWWLARVAAQAAGPTLTVPGTHTALGFSGTAFGGAVIETSCRSGRLTTPGAAGSYGPYTATAGSSANYVGFSVPLPPMPDGFPHRLGPNYRR